MAPTDENPLDPFKHLIDIAAEDGIPLGAHVDLTYRCDLKCVHCYQAERRRKELTLSEYQTFFADLADLGGIYLLVSGGDIFMRADSLQILRAAAQHRFDITAMTHAMSVDDDTADALKEIGMSYICVSVYHTDPTIHDTITRRTGSFERTMAGIQRLLARDIRVIIKCPVFELNPGAEQLVPAMAQALGARYQLNCQMRATNTGGEEPQRMSLNIDAKASVYRCILHRSRNLEDVSVFSPDDRTCIAGQASFYLCPDGTVQPCVDYHESAGNIREQSLSEIWETSPLFARLRTINRSSFSECVTCDDYAFCGLCPALALRETKSGLGCAKSSCEESAAIRRAFE